MRTRAVALAVALRCRYDPVMSRLDQLKKLVQVMPNDPLAHYGLGLEYINLQQWTDAAAAFGEAIRTDAKYSAAYYHKARAEIGGGLGEVARATLTEGMQVARNSGDWHTEGEMKQLLETIV